MTKWVTRICDPSKTYDHIYLRWVTFKRYFMMFRKQVKAGSMSNSKEKSMASIRQNIFHTLNDSIVITLSDRITRKWYFTFWIVFLLVWSCSSSDDRISNGTSFSALKCVLRLGRPKVPYGLKHCYSAISSSLVEWRYIFDGPFQNYADLHWKNPLLSIFLAVGWIPRKL